MNLQCREASGLQPDTATNAASTPIELHYQNRSIAIENGVDTENGIEIAGYGFRAKAILTTEIFRDRLSIHLARLLMELNVVNVFHDYSHFVKELIYRNPLTPLSQDF